jgi:AcrR family transcriptional regulator
MPTQRVRRPPQEARLLILQAAEELLIEGGPHAVQLRAVAERVGITDAGVAHHFSNRQGLHLALLRHGGQRLRRAVEEAAESWIDDHASITDLVDRIAAVYADGYGELAIALHAAGWRDEGVGLLEPVVGLLHAARRRQPGKRLRRHDTQLAVAALHQALATEPAYGEAFRRSAGFTGPEAGTTRPQMRWWANTLSSTLDIPLT